MNWEEEQKQDRERIRIFAEQNKGRKAVFRYMYPEEIGTIVGYDRSGILLSISKNGFNGSAGGKYNNEVYFESSEHVVASNITNLIFVEDITYVTNKLKCASCDGPYHPATGHYISRKNDVCLCGICAGKFLAWKLRGLGVSVKKNKCRGGIRKRYNRNGTPR